MITLFKIGIEFFLFFFVLFLGMYVGIKLQQKWPTKVQDVLSFFSFKSSTTTTS